MKNADMMYETNDVEERCVTMAMHDLFASIAASGVTEDPLALVCKSLVRAVDYIDFAFYCYEGDETGVMAAVRDGVDFFLPPPDVQRKIVADLYESTSDGKVAVITPEQALSLLPPDLRKRWVCHTGIAVRVVAGGRSAAMISVYVRTGFVVTDRHCAWMSLFGKVAASAISLKRMLTSVQTERDDAVKARQEVTLAIESARAQVRSHLAEIAKMKENYKLGTVSLLDAILAIESSANSLYELSNFSPVVRTAESEVLNNAALCKWVEDGIADPRIKAIVGLRGTDKTTILHAARSRVLASGVPESRVVIVNFEDARFRHFKTADDMLSFLRAFPHTDEVKYLFMDELGMVGWHAELLHRLQRSPRWNVWVAASTSLVIAQTDPQDPLDLNVYRTWSDPKKPRSRGDLEKIWCQIFMRDVVSGVKYPDIRAKEMLAEYYSDHIGESNSLRDISKALERDGLKLSAASVRAYRQALIDSYLIELSPIYDVFEGSVVNSLSGHAYYTDIELRSWRFGSAPQNDAARLARNRLYLRLRRKHGIVYTPRGCDADFVTLTPNGAPLMWKVPDDLPAV